MTDRRRLSSTRSNTEASVVSSSSDSKSKKYRCTLSAWFGAAPWIAFLPERGEANHQAASVVGTVLAGDEAALFHPADVMRQATAVPGDLGTKLRRPEHAAGCFRKGHEHFVVSPGQPGVAGEWSSNVA